MYELDVRRVAQLTREAADALEAGDSAGFKRYLKLALGEHEAWLNQRHLNVVFVEAKNAG